ncbi:MAG: hypothetical protein CMH54_07060 [Myxococcales bacterium]|nr:hypothetical protein [Myxococcales bacterium]
MNFVQPIFLSGLVLAAVPILIHLINRKRARRLEFSALEFLLRRDPRLAKRLKMKELLLLLFRTLLVMAIPLALARPYLPSSSSGSAPLGAPRSVVIVVDRGIEQWVDDDRVDSYRPIWNRTVRKAREVLNRLPPGSTAAVIFADRGRPTLLESHLSQDPLKLGRKLSRIKPTYMRSDLKDAAGLARTLLSEEGLEHREIRIVASFSVTDIAELESLDFRGIDLHLHPILRKTPPSNIRLSSVRQSQTSDGGSELITQVENHTASSSDAAVTLQLGKQVVRQAIQLDPNSSKEVRFGLGPSDVFETAEIRLENDDFPPDNTFFFQRRRHEAINVLVVNGSPRPIRFQDEVFFLRRAIEALKMVRNELVVEVVAPEGLKPATVVDRDVIILANIHVLDRDVAHTLKTAVEGGVGLLVTVGDQSDSDFGDSLRDLLVLPLREIHGSDARLSTDDGLGVGNIDIRADGARLLAGKGGESIRQARIFRYAVLAPPSPSDTNISTWVTLENGAPLLLERQQGRGRTMLLATSIDFDWTDLPAHPGYVQLVSVLLDHLSGGGTTSGRSQIHPGDPWTVSLPRNVKIRSVDVKGPDSTAKTEIRKTGERLQLTVREAKLPGSYQVYVNLADGSELKYLFSVNVARSDIQRIPATAKAVKKIENAVGKKHTPAKRKADPDSTTVAGTPVWHFLLFSLVLLLAMEAYTAFKV